MMSTIESNIKTQPIPLSIPPPLSLPTNAPLTPTTSISTPTPPPPPPPTPFYDDRPVEKFYKKQKQISLEFDQIVKGKASFFLFLAIF